MRYELIAEKCDVDESLIRDEVIYGYFQEDSDCDYSCIFYKDGYKNFQITFHERDDPDYGYEVYFLNKFEVDENQENKVKLAQKAFGLAYQNLSLCAVSPHA